MSVRPPRVLFLPPRKTLDWHGDDGGGGSARVVVAEPSATLAKVPRRELIGLRFKSYRFRRRTTTQTGTPFILKCIYACICIFLSDGGDQTLSGEYQICLFSDNFLQNSYLEPAKYFFSKISLFLSIVTEFI